MNDSRTRRYAYLTMLTVIVVGSVLVYMYTTRTFPENWCEEGWRFFRAVPVIGIALLYFPSFLLAKSSRYYDIRWKIFSICAVLFFAVVIGWTLVCSSF